MARIFRLEPTFALGLVVLALCPGGALSNVICGLVRANAALSVSLTAIPSVVTPFTIPFLYDRAADLLSGTAAALELPLGPTIARLFGVSIVPILLGMIVRSRLGPSTDQVERRARRVSVGLFAALVALIVVLNIDALKAGFGQLGGAVLALNLEATCVGFTLAGAFLPGLRARRAAGRRPGGGPAGNASRSARTSRSEYVGCDARHPLPLLGGR